MKGFFIPLLLGIDIGGTKVALALGDERGRVLERARRPTNPTEHPADDLARIAEDARALLARADVTPNDVACVGVSAPGPIDAQGETLLHPPNLPGWGEVPVRAILADALGLRVHVENDANAAVLAEWRFGAGRGYDDVVYLTASTGIGAGLVLGGRLHRGHAGNAGEVGHAPVEWEGLPCACGQRGCLEAYVGGAAWTRRLRAITPATSAVARIAGGSQQARPEHVVAAAGEGDPFARSEMERFNRYLARAIVTLAFVVAPEVVVLGTIPASAGEALCFAPLREHVAEQVWPVLGRDLRIVPAALGSELPDYAGLCAAREGLETRSR
ncbi:MAG: ROK family protein [Myxococcales bacterium]|nr:ROK family protein [Myxococcales bacterium]